MKSLILCVFFSINNSKNLLLMPGRRKFILEGKFKAIPKRGKQFIRNPSRELWLFSDILLIVKPNKLKKNMYNYKAFIPISKLHFSSVEDIDDFKNVIRVAYSETNVRKDWFHLLSAPSVEARVNWIKTLEELTKSIEPTDEALLNQLQVMEVQDQIEKIEVHFFLSSFLLEKN